MMKTGLRRGAPMALAGALLLAGCDYLPFGYTPLKEIVAAPAQFEGREVKVKGRVRDVIKLPILVTVYDLVAQGKLSLDDPLTVLEIDKVPGSGVLQFMHDGMTVSVRDAAVLMTVLSDNTATNLLLDRIIIRRVWQKMEALGLPHTKVHSKTFLRISSVAMDSSVKYGLGVSTPNEMAQLFALLAEGKAVNPAADSAMLEILGNNTDVESMQRDLDGLAVPHKTGATDSVRTECAYFRLTSRVVACGFTRQNTDTRWLVDNEAQVTLGKLGATIVKAWGLPAAP